MRKSYRQSAQKTSKFFVDLENEWNLYVVCVGIFEIDRVIYESKIKPLVVRMI